MESGLYVSLSAQLSLERRIDTVARNVANMNTAGYKADAVKFSTILSKAGSDPVAFASTGDTYISRGAGSVQQTGNALDVAIDGDGWLAMETGNGTGYTRDGRMQMSADGILRTISGNPIMDAGGSLIALDPLGGAPSISKDGTVSQDGAQVAVLGLFEIPEDANLSRVGSSGVLSDKTANPIFEFTDNGFRQGYIEGSNVNPLMEMTKLITITRAFESANSAIQKMETTRQTAIRDLGEA
ncbi:flagellar basal-body rod protein FlgF [Flexibacterium corallicola]|uniref:flagellar basal-body rod protein FlgF n=1 Tax=Flexibacterium corallicola TaxID=3037259 RepID=UPI00286F5372|nr:flagellar basal-body rod protein FlgF [Pseudovibrio sp. M1P-2-3]